VTPYLLSVSRSQTVVLSARLTKKFSRRDRRSAPSLPHDFAGRSRSAATGVGRRAHDHKATTAHCEPKSSATERNPPALPGSPSAEQTSSAANTTSLLALRRPTVGFSRLRSVVEQVGWSAVLGGLRYSNEVKISWTGGEGCEAPADHDLGDPLLGLRFI
jgi:hypothetical protein